MADAVVLLHGLGRTRRSMIPLERALAAGGYATLNLDYPSRRADLVQLADGLSPEIHTFAGQSGGPLHFVTHSMGGLVLRVLLERHRPPHLGRVVMLGPPNHGSELADRLHELRLYRAVFGPAGQQLTTRAATRFNAAFRASDVPIGVIAGVQPAWLRSGWLMHGPSDGKVAVSATRLDGMTDHIVIPCIHSLLMRNPAALAQTLLFLQQGRFRHG